MFDQTIGLQFLLVTAQLLMGIPMALLFAEQWSQVCSLNVSRPKGFRPKDVEPLHGGRTLASSSKYLRFESSYHHWHCGWRYWKKVNLDFWILIEFLKNGTLSSKAVTYWQEQTLLLICQDCLCYKTFLAVIYAIISASA